MLKVVLVLIILGISTNNVFAQTVQDPELVVEEFTTGLSKPTSISFIGSDILVLQKDDGNVRLIRDGIVLYSGEIGQLKRFKEDVQEVKNGYECGIGIKDYNDIKIGDQIEVFEIIQTAQQL